MTASQIEPETGKLVTRVIGGEAERQRYEEQQTFRSSSGTVLSASIARSSVPELQRGLAAGSYGAPGSADYRAVQELIASRQAGVSPPPSSGGRAGGGGIFGLGPEPTPAPGAAPRGISEPTPKLPTEPVQITQARQPLESAIRVKYKSTIERLTPESAQKFVEQKITQQRKVAEARLMTGKAVGRAVVSERDIVLANLSRDIERWNIKYVDKKPEGLTELELSKARTEFRKIQAEAAEKGIGIRTPQGLAVPLSVRQEVQDVFIPESATRYNPIVTLPSREEQIVGELAITGEKRLKEMQAIGREQARVLNIQSPTLESLKKIGFAESARRLFRESAEVGAYSAADVTGLTGKLVEKPMITAPGLEGFFRRETAKQVTGLQRVSTYPLALSAGTAEAVFRIGKGAGQISTELLIPSGTPGRASIREIGGVAGELYLFGEASRVKAGELKDPFRVEFIRAVPKGIYAPPPELPSLRDIGTGEIIFPTQLETEIGLTKKALQEYRIAGERISPLEFEIKTKQYGKPSGRKIVGDVPASEKLLKERQKEFEAMNRLFQPGGGKPQTFLKLGKAEEKRLLKGITESRKASELEMRSRVAAEYKLPLQKAKGPITVVFPTQEELSKERIRTELFLKRFEQKLGKAKREERGIILRQKERGGTLVFSTKGGISTELGRLSKFRSKELLRLSKRMETELLYEAKPSPETSLISTRRGYSAKEQLGFLATEKEIENLLRGRTPKGFQLDEKTIRQLSRMMQETPPVKRKETLNEFFRRTITPVRTGKGSYQFKVQKQNEHIFIEGERRIVKKATKGYGSYGLYPAPSWTMPSYSGLRGPSRVRISRTGGLLISLGRGRYLEEDITQQVSSQLPMEKPGVYGLYAGRIRTDLLGSIVPKVGVKSYLGSVPISGMAEQLVPKVEPVERFGIREAEIPVSAQGIMQKQAAPIREVTLQQQFIMARPRISEWNKQLSRLERSRRRIPERIKPPERIFRFPLLPLTERKPRKFELGLPEFAVFGRRYGREILLAKGPSGRATQIGAKFARETLGRTFYLRPTGRRTQLPDIRGVNLSQFRRPTGRSRLPRGAFVELSRYALTEEQPEIQLARKRSGKRRGRGLRFIF